MPCRPGSDVGCSKMPLERGNRISLIAYRLSSIAIAIPFSPISNLQSLTSNFSPLTPNDRRKLAEHHGRRAPDFVRADLKERYFDIHAVQRTYRAPHDGRIEQEGQRRLDELGVLVGRRLEVGAIGERGDVRCDQ